MTAEKENGTIIKPEHHDTNTAHLDEIDMNVDVDIGDHVGHDIDVGANVEDATAHDDVDVGVEPIVDTPAADADANVDHTNVEDPTPDGDAVLDVGENVEETARHEDAGDSGKNGDDDNDAASNQGADAANVDETNVDDTNAGTDLGVDGGVHEANVDDANVETSLGVDASHDDTNAQVALDESVDAPPSPQKHVLTETIINRSMEDDENTSLPDIETPASPAKPPQKKQRAENGSAVAPKPKKKEKQLTEEEIEQMGKIVPDFMDPTMEADAATIRMTPPSTKLEYACLHTIQRKNVHIARLTSEIDKLKAFIRKRKQSYKRKRKDSGAPTRALSAYNIFVQDRFARLAKENEAALKSTDADVVMKRVPPANLVAATGNEWRDLPPEDKVKFEERAKTDRKRYEEQMAQYQAPEKQANRKRNKTGYNMFFSSHVLRLKQSDHGVPSERGSVARLVGGAWKQLTAEEKQFYEREADKHNGMNPVEKDEIEEEEEDKRHHQMPEYLHHPGHDMHMHGGGGIPPPPPPHHHHAPPPHQTQHDPRHHGYAYPPHHMYGQPPHGHGYYDYSQHHSQQPHQQRHGRSSAGYSHPYGQQQQQQQQQRHGYSD